MTERLNAIPKVVPVQPQVSRLRALLSPEAWLWGACRERPCADVERAESAAMRTAVLAVLVACLGRPAFADDAVRVNPFDDPFLQVTRDLPACREPAPPTFTEAQFSAEAHDRAQRGVSCWMAGRCRLHNAYLYDREIVPRVELALKSSGKFAGTSIWALGQRRYVWLKGCVATPEQAAEAERIVRNIDDVEGVQNQLMVGTQGTPPYATVR